MPCIEHFLIVLWSAIEVAWQYPHSISRPLHCALSPQANSQQSPLLFAYISNFTLLDHLKGLSLDGFSFEGASPAGLSLDGFSLDGLLTDLSFLF